MKRSVDNNIKGRWFFKKETSKTPFGMTMPGRSYNAHTLRHGFTGHEKESDLAEGIYTTEYRLYDARVGRWLSVDPLFEKYVGMSPYNYCMLNPVMMVDPDGRVPIETIWDIGNILYDIGAAICNHIKGKHEVAKENWRDLGLDAAATLIPYVPAGASKVVKVGKVGLEIILKESYLIDQQNENKI